MLGRAGDPGAAERLAGRRLPGSRRALAIAVTIQLMPAGTVALQFWLDRFDCASVVKIAWRTFSEFRGVADTF